MNTPHNFQRELRAASARIFTMERRLCMAIELFNCIKAKAAAGESIEAELAQAKQFVNLR